MPSDPGVSPAPTDPAHDPRERADLWAWREAYLARLAAPTGWWAVANLAWLQGDAGWLGAAPDCELPMQAPSPPRVARLERVGDDLVVTPSGEVPLRLDGEALTTATRLGPDGGRLRLEQDPAVEVALFLRSGRWGVRVYDPSRAAARDPGDLAWFDVEPGWRVLATALPGDGETLPIVDLLGDVRETPVEARLRFTLAGRERTLLATAQGDRLFVNFRDATNGATSYGAGRFLVADAPVAGTTVLDFHRAYAPPCAHTPYAMCPLPPLANRLDVAVTAGERSRVA